MSASEFLKRMSKSSEHRLTVEMAFNAVNTFRQNASEIHGNARLSDRGKAEEIGALADKLSKEFFAEMNRQVDADRNKLKVRKEHFQLKPPLREDVVGALDRHEQRAYLRGLDNPGLRQQLAEDPSFAAAIIHAPAALSGVSPEIQERVKAAELDRQFGRELRIIQGEADDLDVTEAALQVAHTQVLGEAGITTKTEGNWE